MKGIECQGCPAQYEPCLQTGTGDNPAHIIVVGASPSGFSIGQRQSFYGRHGRLFKQLLQLIQRRSSKYAGVKAYYTYATMVGAYEPSAEHIAKCRPILMRQIRSVRGFNDRLPVIVSLGPVATKALGISFQKIVDVVGREFTASIPTPNGTQAYQVIPLLSMPHLEMQVGTSNIVLAALLKAVSIAYGEQDRKITLEELTRDYVYPKTIDEVSNLVDEVIQYYDPKHGTGPEQWTISLDTETNTLKPFSHPDPKVLMLSVAWDDQKAATILLDHPEVPYDPAEAWKHVERLLACPKPKCFHNWKFDRKFLETLHGYTVNRVTWDTLLGEHYIDEDKKGHYSLKQLTPLYCPHYEGYDDELHAILRGNESADDEDADDLVGRPQPLKLSDEEISKYHTENGCPTDRIEPLWKELVKAISKRTKLKKIKKAERTDAQRVQFELLKKEIDSYRKQLEVSRPSRKKKAAEANGENGKVRGGGFTDVPLETILQYAAVDADVTRIILRAQVMRLQRSVDWEDAKRVMRYLYLPGSKTLGDMEFRGFQQDAEYRDALITEVSTRINELRELFARKFDPTLNLNAPQQISEYMRRLNFAAIPGEEVGSTGKDIMDKYATIYPANDPRAIFAQKLIEYREATKTLGTYLRPYAKMARADGKIHCSFHLNGTSSGRLCVDAATELVTSHGTFPIAELPEELLGTAKIKTHRNRWRRIVRKYYKGSEQMYRVTLSNGSQITCTAGHRFLTPSGWRCLHDATAEKQGSYVYTIGYACKGTAPGSFRKEFCEDCPERRPNRKGGVTQVQLQPPCLAHFYECIQGKIRKRDKGLATQTLRQVEMGEPTRTEEQTSSYNRQRNFTKNASTWNGAVSNIRKPWYKRLVCAGKHQTPSPESHRPITNQNAKSRLWFFETVRAILSRNYVPCRKLLQRPAYILSKSIQSLRPFERIDMVCEGTDSGACVLRGEGFSSAGSYLLVSQQSRNAAVFGTPRKEYSACTAVHVLSEQKKLQGGFRVSKYQSIGRNRRGLPQKGRANTKAGFPKKGTGNADGLQDGTLYRQRSVRKCIRCSEDNPYGIAQIEKVEDVGPRPVWDIEVEEDHSYVAQGFINHNSSASPNLQNVPYITARRTKKDADGDTVVVHPGYNIKKLFIPSKKNYVVVNCDIKGAELRVYTAYSQDELMIDALRKGMDVHSLVTSKVYKLDYDEVQRLKETDPGVKEKRNRCKRVVFATFYGGGPFTIAQQINSTREEAEQLQNFLFNEFPALRNYVTGVEREVRAHQQVSTFFGRRRRFRLAHVDRRRMSDAIREAVNFKIQSTSADLVLSQMCEMDDNFADIGAEMLITVHDSVVFQMPKSNLHMLHDFLDRWIVERVADKYDWLPVPFLYDVEVGPSYGEAKPFDREDTYEQEDGDTAATG